MLMLREDYLRRQYGRSATILGIPRLKAAPGAIFEEATFTPTRQEFLAAVALHNTFSPRTVPFVSTREGLGLGVELAQGGGCLFTLNCSTTPGGYALRHGGCQFAAHSYDAPVYAEWLRAEGFTPVFRWSGSELGGAVCQATREAPSRQS